ncbi:coproporphyrinogen III oxidase [Rhodovulum sp. 12E13]|uniref:radical SAM family heme chaperone HemW n=1 Tax=Rhodovulum sp. 12E13 TaxID=2203891 RepID=UPI000E155902|nr:radical SAM family heme chaperone HemW [Rhodovulum sp. 12E13]RDC73779.1 coproporphyrinogen III oxidase [Rhodovulum sp. 12E13]
MEEGAGFGLYVHWPFCQAKCPYCDFNSHVVTGVDQARWARALAGDVARVAGRTGGRHGGRRLTSVFFGGGTPSLMEPETVAAVMDAARAGWVCANDLEVTLEANPTSVEAGRFGGYRDAGVNRVSLGVQALNDSDLKRLGRLHSAAEARAAFDVARRVFDRVSFDLICARQDQTREAWAAELDEALAMAVDHLSLYQLTIEPGTAFAARQEAGKLRGLPDEDLGADLYEMTVERCEAAGLRLYEVSNFARPGAECRHNLLYWSGGDYAGVGPGAHGRLTLDGRRVATEQVSAPGAWLAGVETAERAHEREEEISVSDQVVEYLLMGLRKREGVALSALSALGDAGASVGERAQALKDVGLLEAVSGRMRATPRGRLLLDRLVAELAG